MPFYVNCRVGKMLQSKNHLYVQLLNDCRCPVFSAWEETPHERAPIFS